MFVINIGCIEIVWWIDSYLSGILLNLGMQLTQPNARHSGGIADYHTNCSIRLRHVYTQFVKFIDYLPFDVEFSERKFM